MEAEIKSGNLYRGIDAIMDPVKDYDVSFQGLIEQKLKNIEKIRAEQDAHRIKYNLTGMVVPTQVEQAISEKKACQRKN